MAEVAVPMQVDLERLQQRRAAGAVVVDQRREHPPGEGVQTCPIFDLRQQPINAQALVVDDLLAFAEAHHQVERPLGLEERGLEVVGLYAQPANRHRYRDTQLRLGDRLADPRGQLLGLRVLAVRGLWHEHDDAVAVRADEVARMVPANGAGHDLEQLVFERDDAAFLVAPLPDEAPEVVHVHHQQPVRHGEVVAQVSRAALHVGLVAEGAVEQVIDQFAAYAVLGFGDLALLDHLERDDGGRVLDRHHRQLLEMLGVIDDRQVAQVLAAGQNGSDDARRGQPQLGKGRDFVGHAAADHDLEHALDGRGLADLERGAVVSERLLPVLVGHTRGHVARQQAKAHVLQRDRALDQLTQRLDDRVEALAVQGEVGELPVDLDGAPELRVLGVDDPLQDWVHDLQVGDIRRDTDQGDFELVRLPDHVVWDLRQVAFRLDHQPGRADRGQVAHQVLLGRLIVLDGEGHRQQELTLGEPADRLWGFEHLHPGNGAVEAAGPGQHLAPPQSPQRHRFPDSQRHGSD